MSQDVTLATIQSDFAVDLLAQGDGCAVFGALRRDVWHFVYWSEDNGANHVSQYHVPRYALADVLEGLLSAQLESDEDLPEQGPWEVIWRGVAMSVKADDQICLHLMQTEVGLPVEYCDAMYQDVAALVAAKNLVKPEGDQYALPTQETYHGNLVLHASEPLIEAIAFEGEVRGEFNAAEFGIYSAFCTMHDFSHEEQLSVDGAQEAVAIQFEYFAPGDLPKDVLDAVMAMQEALLSEPIWGLGIDMDAEQAAQILADGFKKLGEDQATQYVLLTEMYNAGVLVVLATVLGFMGFDRYADLKADGLAPESEEEQSVRADLTFIELLGLLAR